MAKPAVVIVARERSYVTGELAQAADNLGIDILWVSDRCHVIDEMWPTETIAVELDDPLGAATLVAVKTAGMSFDAAIGTDETSAIVAEAIARALGAPAGTDGAAARAQDKLATRQTLTAAGLEQPRFVVADPRGPVGDVSFPAVVKPRCLSASRGVMRVDDRTQLDAALARVATLLGDAEVKGRYGELASSVVIEDYIAGPEVALDAVLSAGVLHPIAVFDKPRPLDGPTFSESLYVVPTALADEQRSAVIDAATTAAVALGLREGPIHAELRLGRVRPVVIELAARSVGGLCGRTLRLAAGASVSTIVLARLCRIELPLQQIAPAGVAMLAPPAAGIFVGMAGVEDALAIEGIEQVEITAAKGQRVMPLPDGSDYLGFVFARGSSRREVIAALEAAERALVAEIRAAL